MPCSACGAAIKPGRRFCGACGAAVDLSCGHCGFANDHDDRFCGGCGRPLGQATVPAPADRRRVVTVLFADLCGYTALSARLDPEELGAILEQFFDRVDATVLSFGGSIDKHIGDNVMAIFGAPVAHDDDPERAVGAALEIHRRVAELALDLGENLALTIGIATGEVLASAMGSRHHTEYTVTGDAVNLASRLQSLAGRGQTLVSEAVWTATRDRCAYAALGEHSIKGFDTAQNVYRLEGRTERAEPARPMIGRDRELAELDALLAACRAGARRVVGIRGEAGIGKSRMLGAVAERAAALGVASVRAHAVDFGGQTGLGLIEQLARTGAPAADDPFERDLLGSPTADDRQHLAQLTLELRAAGRASALARRLEDIGLVLVEDAHWASSEDLSALERALARRSDAGVLAILTTRPEGALPFADVHWLDLGPLSADQATTLARSLLGDDGTADVVARAGGNPLFLEQLVAHRQEGGDRVPPSIRSLVLARTDRLSPVDRQVIDAAAILGQRFDPDAVRAMLGLDEVRFDRLLASRLVERAGPGMVFHHALIRDGVVSALTRGRRRELHLAAATWFADRDLPLWALHLELADDPRAPRAHLEAALAERTAMRFPSAGALVRRGLKLASAREDTVDLALELGSLELHEGDGRAAVAAFDRALELATTPLSRCQAQVGRGAGYRLLSLAEPAFRALDAAEPLASELGRQDLASRIHYHRGSLLFTTGELSRSRTEHERALALARAIGDVELEARGLSGLADADFYEGKMRAARDAFAACLERCERLGLDRYAIPNRLMHAETLHLLGDAEGARRGWDRAAEDTERLGASYPRILMYTQRGMHQIHLGHLDEAEVSLDRCQEMIEQLGAVRYGPEALAARAELEACRGNRSLAIAHAREAVAGARESGLPYVGPMALGVLAWVDHDRSAFEEAESVLAQGSMWLNHLTVAQYGLELAFEIQDEALHHHCLRRMTEAAASIPAYAWFADRAIARWAFARGDRDEALRTVIGRWVDRARRCGADPRMSEEIRAFFEGT